MKKIKYTTIEEEIELLQKKCVNSSISLEDILHILSGKGRPLVLLILSLPFCQPIQIPGLSTPFGLAVAFIGLRMAFGRNPWLPKSILSKRISQHTLQTIIDKTQWAVKKIKPWIHPRHVWLAQHPLAQIANGLLIAVLGILLALPLPIPFTNLISAWAIFLLALGELEDDGSLILIGYGISLATFIFFLKISQLSLNMF